MPLLALMEHLVDCIALANSSISGREALPAQGIGGSESMPQAKGEASLSECEIRLARPEDEDRLQAIRRAAFAPIFASFRALLGDEIYDLAQRRSDEAQEGLLTSLMTPDPTKALYVVESKSEIVGFVAVLLDRGSLVGEIGLNAVDPAHAGRGFGSAMYDFALTRMREAGMQVATVSTGGDPSHAAARHTYEKVGFDAVIPSVWMCRKL